MQDFESFFKQNRNQIMAIAESNTYYNAKGLAVLSKDDPWREDTAWDINTKGVHETESRHCNAAHKA